MDKLTIFQIVGSFFILLAFVQIGVALGHGWGTVGQARQRAIEMGYTPENTPPLLPVLVHGSTWGNIFLWWIMAAICAEYGPLPSARWQVVAAVLIAGAVCIALYLSWPRGGDELSAHAKTPAGPIMGVQLAFSLVIAVSFFAFASNVTREDATTVAIWLFVYALLSQQIHLMVFGRGFYKRNPLADRATWYAMIGAAAALGLGWARIVYHWW